MIRFKPAKFLQNGNLQTLYPAFFSKPSLESYEREIFELEDGDFLEVVWHNKPKSGDGRPIVILFHGLAGSFNSPYIQRAMQNFAGRGYATVVMQFRGCGLEPNRLARAYHSGDTADAKAWISHLREYYHDSTLLAVGYSLGGNVLLKLLGELKDASPLSAAIAVSVPLLLEKSVVKINSGFSKLYQFNMLRVLKRQLKEKYKYHDMYRLLNLKESEIDAINSFETFDNLYTAPIHGFKDAYSYYKASSSKQYLKSITTPTLIIHALNDPFIPSDIFPSDEELSDAVTFELHPSGGHVGFVSGTIFKPIYWLEPRMLEFLDTIRDTIKRG